jgi:hypothetical protein
LSRSRSTALDALLLFLLTALLIFPLFRIDYFNDWMSIEGSFIADARYIHDHWPHPNWDALWYCGNRFDYIYPPGTRYGAAIVSLVLHVVPARGYHIYTGLMYCLGVAGIYVMARVGSGSRASAWVAAGGYALISPEFAFLKAYKDDSMRQMPERLNALIKWGEGPHSCALALIPWGVAFALLAFRGRRWWTVAAASLCFALVVTNNFYGAVALVIFYPLAVWSMWLTHQPPAHTATGFWKRVMAIPVLTATLCACWFTPSYVLLTERNLLLVAIPGNGWSKWVGLVLLLVFAGGSWLAARRYKASSWSIFVAGCMYAFLAQVVGQFWFHFRIWGEPMRFILELDMALILGITEVLRRVWRRKRWLGIALTAILFSFSYQYLAKPWSVFIPDPNWQQRIEYRMPEWVAQNLPGSRVFTNGSISYWYSTWRDIPQVEGGSDQGMQELQPALARYQIMVVNDPQRDIWWLQSLGADAIVLSDSSSQEIYHGVQQPRKFAGILPVLYDRGGDIVYRVPRKPGLARVVNERQMSQLPPIPWDNKDRGELRAYAEAIEAVPTLAAYARPASDRIEIAATTGPGESIAVQESFDPGWSARVDERQVPIERDVMNFMRVQTTPGTHKVRFQYRPTLEMRLGRWVTAASLLVVAGLCFI